ncbi:MAG: 1-(5-phosphoribosyl)-5-[(5-phosphoribosylamino)methylideneamino]imidazole-4-carboxamide isomerase [Xanthomonadaceae bacterium]|jgi:phosphoribosylformimino-5-aminoimidazole carboxamide ribotide isomerase|nr:1-(5-phosphoribosyl)-5-[(5-phosphoribosylamino)methylideneamino]imidazole-4-carboxamide isomerase [Xanthomonadaceae bacterium]
MNFIIYPALDIREGRVVRLAQGDYSRETHYGNDALERARAFADAGAQWMHLVDLDAARAGGYTLLEPLNEITRQTGLKIQTGGGVRSREDVVRILDAGAARVVIGSLAVREPKLVLGWLKEFGPERITIALDTRQDEQGIWRLPVHGWTETAEQTLDEFAVGYADAGLRHLLCTDISRDGMMSGPNLELYVYLQRVAPDLAVQASGGIRDINDISASREVGCAGAILGRALLEGKLTLKDALSC